MKVHDSAPLICEYPQGDSYFSHDPSPPFLSTTIHLDPELGESDSKSSWTPANPHDDRILPATWGCPVDLTDFELLGGGVKGNGRGFLADYPSSPYSTTTRSVGYSLTFAASTAEGEPHINGISYQGLLQSRMIHDTLIAEPLQNLRPNSTADLFVGHHTRKDAIDHSLPQNQIVQTDAKEKISGQGNNSDDECAMAANPISASTDIAVALGSGLDSHLREKEDEWRPSTTKSGRLSSSMGPEVLYSCPENKQLDPVTMPNPHLSQNSTDTSYTSTSSSARSRQCDFSGELQRPHRSRQLVAYDAPFYGFENGDISLSHYSRLNKVSLTLGHESIELDDLSSLAQSHREHIWSVAHEGEYGIGLVGERDEERFRQARHKRVRRWVPPAPYEVTSYTASCSGHSHGYRSGDHESTDPTGISSSSAGTHQKPFKAPPRPRVIQAVPPQPRVSDAVFGPNSYDEAVANGTDQKRPPLTNWQKTKRIVRQQWKNWLCVALLLSLAITVPVVLKKSHSQVSLSSVEDGDREGGGTYGNTRTSATASSPRFNTSQKSSTAHHKTVVTRSATSKQPSVSTASAVNNSSATAKPGTTIANPSTTTSVVTTSAPKS